MKISGSAHDMSLVSSLWDIGIQQTDPDVTREEFVEKWKKK